MTPEEYVQLKAFARHDGALMALLWIGSLICYIQGLSSPVMGMLALMLIIATPFFAASRLRHFRNYAREGIISFARGYAYTILIFFYGGLLLAAAIYIYFAFIDGGFLMAELTESVHSEDGRQLLQSYGMVEQMNDQLKLMSTMRPIDFALNMLTINIMSGLFLGLPIAALTQKVKVKTEK